MSTLIKVGCLVMTPEQFERALREEMTISQALEMIRRENAHAHVDDESESKEDENV